MKKRFLLFIFLVLYGNSVQGAPVHFKHVTGKNGKDTFTLKEKPGEVNFKFIHIHSFGNGKGSCSYCHTSKNPSRKDVEKINGELVCIKCHQYIYEKISTHLYHHKNIKNCVLCHDPHQSDNIAMLKGNGIMVCLRCHAKNSKGYCIHPQGDKHLDPRNGQPITCITCHYTMGTDYKYLLKKDGEEALCYQCHSPKRYK
ncbi:cytochrome c3 family protein [Desulfurobacterium sp.]|uniref:cytochrome c3 family protein n=1 Tax=Desulfurobacterium sp. TaxID=2004706 RepID=UPI00261A6681|nr:cytochrome c3 family protein [Desulfurobacterium sp.]